MTNTTYYNLNIVEGIDIVNPLTVDNPNYEKIDEVMHNNAVSGVTLATEIANATVHAITRENSDCAVIRFIATSEWKAGDTATVDGVPVTALLPSGETLPDGAYVINANVLCILTGTNLTVFADRKKTDTANEIKYKNTNVEAELDKINSNLSGVISSRPYLIRELKLGRENGSDDLTEINTSFFAGGWWLGSILNNRMVILTFNVNANKSSIDWCFQLKNGLRPCNTVYFSYYLGNQLCRGYVQTDGYVYFDTLNTTDVISATIIFPVG